MTTLRIVFWQQVASIHQLSMLRALAAQPGVDVVIAVDREVPAWRRASGWFDLDLCRVTVVYHDDLAATLP